MAEQMRFDDVIVSMLNNGIVSGNWINFPLSDPVTGEVTASPTDDFQLLETRDAFRLDNHNIETVIKTYFVGGKYAGNAVAMSSTTRVTTLARRIFHLRDSGRIDFNSCDIYCDSTQSDGALVFDQQLAVKFSLGRGQRRNNYYVDILECSRSVVEGVATNWHSMSVIERVFDRFFPEVQEAEQVAMKRLLRLIRTCGAREVGPTR